MIRPELIALDMARCAATVRGHRGWLVRFLIRWRNRLLPQFMHMEF